MSESDKYRVDASRAILDRFRVLAFRATRKGLIESFASAVREMYAHLEFNPTTWGDPMFLYPAIGWLQYQRAIGPLYLCYCVDEVHRVVFIKLVLPFPGRGLESVP